MTQNILLAGFGGHCYGQIISDHIEGYLIYNLGNYRIDLSGHDGRTVLLGGKVDFEKTGSRTGRHEPQVICNLGKRDSACLYSTGYSHEGVQILGGINKIKGLDKFHAGHLGNIGNNAA